MYMKNNRMKTFAINKSNSLFNHNSIFSHNRRLKTDIGKVIY